MRRSAFARIALLTLCLALLGAPARAQTVTGLNTPANPDGGPPTPLYFGTGNTVYVEIDANGNVSLGPAGGLTPTNKLDVVGAVAVGAYAGTAAPANSLIVSGRVGIGKTNPAFPLDVTGNTNVTGTGNFGSVVIGGPANTTTLSVSGMTSLASYVGIGVAPSNSYALDLGTAGAVHAEAYYYASDAGLKTNIHPIENALQTIVALKGVNFTWKKDAAKEGTAPTEIGFIAQDVEKVAPELVQTDATSGMKSVDYARVAPLLVNALQEQQQEMGRAAA